MADGLLCLETDSRPRCASPDLDVIFVHGLGGEQAGSWENENGVLWPLWLLDAFENINVYFAGYETSKFGSLKKGQGTSIQDIAGALADDISSRANKAKNILLITHSMGGLIVKQLLRRCSESLNKAFQSLYRSIRGIAFLGTPHFGSGLAEKFDFLIGKMKSKQVQQLKYAEEELLDLNNFFANHIASTQIDVRSYYETQETWGVKIVDKVCGNPHVPGVEPIAVETDHIGICKPESEVSKLFKSLSAMVSAHASGPAQGKLPITKPMEDSPGTSEHFSEALAEYSNLTKTAEHDRRSLAEKLSDANRLGEINTAEIAKEKFAMALHKSLAQPSITARYVQLLSEIESRFNRFIQPDVKSGKSNERIDERLHSNVLEHCQEKHSTHDNPLPFAMVDGAFYYLMGNCHLALDND